MDKRTKQILLAVAAFLAFVFLWGWSWQASLLLMGAIYWHELGHIWAMKRCGLDTRGIFFIPLLGAVAIGGGASSRHSRRVFIALMGPVAGLVSSVATFLVYLATGSRFFGAATGLIAIFNLFNLLPAYPLDGGQVLRSVAGSFSNRTGMILMMIGNILSVVFLGLQGFLFFAILIIMMQKKNQRALTNFGDAEAMDRKETALTILAFLGTAILLVGMTILAGNALSSTSFVGLLNR